jgi:DNA-binding NarL/FixJ family response regulator
VSEPITVLIADDHVLYREGIKSMLADRPEVLVVGEAATGPEAVELARTLRPDVVLMDLKMPGLNGIAATRQIVECDADAAVLVLTMFDDDSVVAAMRAGARGYLLKDAGIDELMRAILAVRHGEVILGPSAGRRMAAFVSASSRSDAGAFPGLTEREVELLALMAAGRDNRHIASTLHLSDKTVRNYVSAILGKLHAHNRAEAVALARDAGVGGDQLGY